MVRIGQKLHETRVKKGLSLEDVSAATKIRPTFLAAIERGEYHKLPAASYAKVLYSITQGFLGFPNVNRSRFSNGNLMRREHTKYYQMDFHAERNFLCTE